MDLNSFIKWQAEKDSRHVDIEIRKGHTKIWVYDYNLVTGQFVEDVSEIDIAGKKEADERATLKQLQEKYGG